VSNPQAAADLLEQAFNRILDEQMTGIPLLNNRLKVQTLGFQEHQGRIIGVLITPWLMNLVMLPGEDDDWNGLELGKKQPHKFPSNTYKFIVNEIEGIGKCQAHSLYSPMNEFVNQDHALAAAQGFLDTLMVETKPAEEDPVDQDLLGRILRGEEIPDVNLDHHAIIEATDVTTPVREASEKKVQVGEKISRRELLRGSFLKDA